MDEGCYFRIIYRPCSHPQPRVLLWHFFLFTELYLTQIPYVCLTTTNHSCLLASYWESGYEQCSGGLL